MKVNGRYVHDEGTTWPRANESEDNSVEWLLRYGTPSKTDLLYAASVMNAYHCLIWCSDKRRREVVKMLRQAESAKSIIGRDTARASNAKE